MKNGVIILNCARGEIVNTEDLAHALNEGIVGGYGADVLDVEPPPSDHPFYGKEYCNHSPYWIPDL